jgi:hypothetical protein
MMLGPKDQAIWLNVHCEALREIFP